MSWWSLETGGGLEPIQTGPPPLDDESYAYSYSMAGSFRDVRGLAISIGGQPFVYKAEAAEHQFIAG